MGSFSSLLLGISFSGREGSVSWACVGTKDGFCDSRSGLFKRHNCEYINITCSFVVYTERFPTVYVIVKFLISMI